MDLRQAALSNGLFRMFQYTLDYSASITMFGKLRDLTVENVCDEASVMCGHPLDDFLNDVVPVLVLN